MSHQMLKMFRPDAAGSTMLMAAAKSGSGDSFVAALQALSDGCSGLQVRQTMAGFDGFARSSVALAVIRLSSLNPSWGAVGTHGSEEKMQEYHESKMSPFIVARCCKYQAKCDAHQVALDSGRQCQTYQSQ